ncbi:MAG: helix-turn-helix domain-containing protein [Thermoplasmata archaeon]
MELELMEKIAGEITLSSDFGKTLRKWREAFHITQQELCKEMNVSPSIISDYEGGRRKSPGIASIKKIVESLISIDKRKGGHFIKQFSMLEPTEAIYSIREFPIGIRSTEFIKQIEGEVLAGQEGMEKDLFGYTVIDSIKAITTFGAHDYLKIYGWSSQRALIFIGVKYGRSPMIAVRAHPMKPAMVVYLKPERIDELALTLARIEKIPLVATHLALDDLIRALQNI